jgi:hypothetical protein
LGLLCITTVVPPYNVGIGSIKANRVIDGPSYTIFSSRRLNFFFLNEDSVYSNVSFGFIYKPVYYNIISNIHVMNALDFQKNLRTVILVYIDFAEFIDHFIIRTC